MHVQKTPQTGQVRQPVEAEDSSVGRRRRGTGRQPASPSDRASARLRGDVSREVADLRLQLEEAALRSDAYLQAGYPEEAAEVVDEQRQLLSRFQARLRQSMSEAAVEAEAERVLAAAPGAAAFSDDPDPSGPSDAPRFSPALVSAVVAALLAVLAIGGPGADGTLSAAESPSAEDPSTTAVAALDGTAEGPGHARSMRPAPAVAPDPSAASAGGGAATPDPSPTERLAGLIDELVEAADDAVRDALRVLFGSDQTEPDEAAGDLVTPAIPDGDDASEPSDDAPRDGSDADAESGDPEPEPTEEPSEQGSEGDDGVLPPVSTSFDGGGDPDAGR